MGKKIQENWNDAALIMSRGTAMSYIQQHGEPKTVEEVSKLISNNDPNGFAYWSVNKFKNKMGGFTRITKKGEFCACLQAFGGKYIVISHKPYDFSTSLINNIKELYNITPTLTQEDTLKILQKAKIWFQQNPEKITYVNQ